MAWFSAATVSPASKRRDRCQPVHKCVNDDAPGKGVQNDGKVDELGLQPNVGHKCVTEVMSATQSWSRHESGSLAARLG